MNGCSCENWTLKDLSYALMDKHKDNKKIVVPMFQRGKRWKRKQEEVFIDSLKKGYPVGTMLFYRRVEGKKEIYTLVDGLQRGNTIRKYMTAPTKYFLKEAVPKNIINNIFINLNVKEDEKQCKMRILEIVTKYVQGLDSLSAVQYYPVANKIMIEFAQEKNELLNKFINILEPFLKDLQTTFDKIANTIIPIIVYSGDEDL